jgi:predicted phosphodiesterase
MIFRAEVISDTHLNMWKYKPDKLMQIFSLQAPNLILAGDIGDPDESTLHVFLDLARKNYKHVCCTDKNYKLKGTYGFNLHLQ